jgi:hypothetical protein
MTVLLTCPRCGLTTRSNADEAEEDEACPRCLARTSGALSVYMRTKRRPSGKSGGRLGFTSRLLRRQTAS